MRARLIVVSLCVSRGRLVQMVEGEKVQQQGEVLQLGRFATERQASGLWVCYGLCPGVATIVFPGIRQR